MPRTRKRFPLGGSKARESSMNMFKRGASPSDRKRYNIYICEEVMCMFKSECALKSKSLSQGIEELIQKELQKAKRVGE